LRQRGQFGQFPFQRDLRLRQSFETKD
jgi:hypothetical protein